MDTEKETLPRNSVTEEEKSTITVTKVTVPPPDTTTEEQKSTITITKDTEKETLPRNAITEEEKSTITITKDSGKETAPHVTKIEEKKSTITVTKANDVESDDLKLEVNVAKNVGDTKQDGERKLTIVVGKDGIGFEEDRKEVNGEDDADGINFLKDNKSNAEKQTHGLDEPNSLRGKSDETDSKAKETGDKKEHPHDNTKDSKSDLDSKAKETSDKKETPHDNTKDSKSDAKSKEPQEDDKKADAHVKQDENKSDKHKTEDTEAKTEQKYLELPNNLSEQEIDKIIAGYSKTDEKKRKQLLAFYFSIDTERRGYFTIYQFARRVRKGKYYYLTDADVAHMFCGIDSNNDNLVSLDEYMAEMSKMPRQFSEDDMHFWYDQFDQDGDGYVSREDLQTTIEKADILVLPEKINEYMRWDTSGLAEKLDFSGFCRCFKNEFKSDRYIINQ